MSPNLLSYEQAAACVRASAAELLQHIHPPVLRVPLHQAAGRTLAAPLVADRDQPPFPRSLRDGFACRAAEASLNAPLVIAGSSRAGDLPPGLLPTGSAWEIMTGASLPEGADAVMMIEHVQVASGSVALTPPRSIKSGDNFVTRGAEARAGQVLLSPGAVLSPGQIALAASCGYAEIEVFARPRVAILCTGDEIVPVDHAPKPGQIRNSNGPMLAALVSAAGGDPWLLPPAADSPVALDDAIAKAKDADMLLVTGGVSAGKYDLVEPALQRAGAAFLFTGIRMQPGKPTVFGHMPGRQERMPLFGLPGNPISSAVTFLLYASPILAALAGRAINLPRFAVARLAADLRHAPGLTRFLPASCSFGVDAEWPRVERIPWQGSGDLAAYARANCFLVLPEDQEFLAAGSDARILLF